ncbi:WD40/YVTN/BNR-like repeat-containing protein [Micromonospora sp. NPDC004336]
MPDLDLAGLDRAAQAAFKPDFTEVRRRAARRRRTHLAAASLATLSLVAVAGAAVASGGLRGASHQAAVPGFAGTSTPAFIPTAAPSGTPSPGPATGRTVRRGTVVAGDLDHFYLRWSDCRGDGPAGTGGAGSAPTDCALMVAGTADRGATWQSRELPLPRNARVVLAAAGPRTLVASYQDGSGMRQGWLTSVDGGERWREVTVGTAARVPDGWRVLDELSRPHIDAIVAANPVTGDVVRVPHTSGLKLATLVDDVPPGAGIWVSGYENEDTNGDGRLVGRGSAIAVSRDGGRTWTRHVFAGPLTAGEDISLDVATRDGRTVYAVGSIDGALVVHRSGDGGLTWRRAAGTADVGARPLRASVRADGTLLVQAGLVAGDRPLMFGSGDGGQRFSPMEPAPGAAVVPVPGGYTQSGGPHLAGMWWSADGVAWSFLGAPDLP